MCLYIFPDVDKCCHCITDLKTASAIIAVLAVMTSPILAWAIIRHSYVIRVSCIVTTSTEKEDVVDINFNNVISLGFGANAGLGSSCFYQKTNSSSTQLNKIVSPSFVNIIKWIGWTVLLSDLIFIIVSLIFLIRLFGSGNPKINVIAQLFLYSGILSTFLSFVYGMLYVATCLIVGGKFPVIEFLFVCIDLAVWTYFLKIINAYRRRVVLTTDVSTKVSNTDVDNKDITI